MPSIWSVDLYTHKMESMLGTFHKPHAEFHRGAVDIGSGLPYLHDHSFDRLVRIGPSKVVLQSNSVNATELETTQELLQLRCPCPLNPALLRAREFFIRMRNV